jgi:hypothetical protein
VITGARAGIGDELARAAGEFYLVTQPEMVLAAMANRGHQLRERRAPRPQRSGQELPAAAEWGSRLSGKRL